MDVHENDSKESFKPPSPHRLSVGDRPKQVAVELMGDYLNETKQWTVILMAEKEVEQVMDLKQER